jgi:hypothetical protein
MWRNRPLLARFFSKLVLDILPAALASAIGGLLFSHFDWSQVWNQMWAPVPAVERVAPASAEMMQLVRDEHAAVLSYVKAQVAAERNRFAAQDAEAKAVSDAPATTAPTPPGGAAVAAIEAKPLAPPVQEPAAPVVPAAAAVPVLQAPLVIAQADRDEGNELTGYRQAPLLAATVNIKDHVVATTQHAFAVIGGIPSWIVGLGGRITGQGGVSASPAGRFAGESG